MATYKVIQDIEAEDHILGPLTLRQFIFALISVFFFYICFLLLTKGAGFLLVLFLPPALFFGFFAVPFGRDQPTEIWALAKLRFWLKPRSRIWDQSGIKELVTITVPKKIERQLTDGLTQYEVESRLKVLASTLDTRGWAIKNSLVPQMTANRAGVESDRLIDFNSFSQVSDTLPDETDVMDDESSPVAQQFTQMINQSSTSHRQQLINQMNSPNTATPASTNNKWFMPPGASTSPPGQQPTVYAPDVEAGLETAEESAISSRIKARQQAQQMESNNLRTLRPAGDSSQTQFVSVGEVNNSSTQPAPLTQQPDPAILSLANSDDLSVQAIAHEAKRAKGENSDEVVISLH